MKQLLLFSFLLLWQFVSAQDPNELVKAVRLKLEKVNDYAGPYDQN
jgi:hypothetical protein